MIDETLRGVVINMHALGAVVRLEDGRLARFRQRDIARNRILTIVHSSGENLWHSVCRAISHRACAARAADARC